MSWIYSQSVILQKYISPIVRELSYVHNVRTSSRILCSAWEKGAMCNASHVSGSFYLDVKKDYGIDVPFNVEVKLTNYKFFVYPEAQIILRIKYRTGLRMPMRQRETVGSQIPPLERSCS